MDKKSLPLLALPFGVILLPLWQYDARVSSSQLQQLLVHNTRSYPLPAGWNRDGKARVPIVLVPHGSDQERDGWTTTTALPIHDDGNMSPKYGVLALADSVRQSPTEGNHLSTTIACRVAIKTLEVGKVLSQAGIEILEDKVPMNPHFEERFQRMKQLGFQLKRLRLAAQNFDFGLSQAMSDMLIVTTPLDSAGRLADALMSLVDATYEEKLQILTARDVADRVDQVSDLLARQLSKLPRGPKSTALTTTILPLSIVIPQLGSDNEHRPHKPIVALPPSRSSKPSMPSMRNFNSGRPPSGADEDDDEISDLRKRLDKAGLSPEAVKVATKELKRLEKLNPAQAEYSVVRNYLENLSEVPWSAVTDDQLGRDTLAKARKQLDDDHYGLEKVKKRLLEYLAVLRLKQSARQALEVKAEAEKTSLAAAATDVITDPSYAPFKQATAQNKALPAKSPILLLVGPPGVGKTSLAKSVARALNRKFHRISLGGVRDEAEIRGHRRTYVAAMPGVIVQGLKKCGVSNPVMLLDEIDKLGHANLHGDPSAAMLEVLDPEQNHTFVDHYVNIPLDLSKTLFIATANSLETIPAPLLDRMEVVHLPGYTTLEKRQIATRYLIPKQTKGNGLEQELVRFGQDVVSRIIESYTREAGVRNLEREIGSVCRAKAVEYADAKDADKLDAYAPDISLEDVERILGPERFEEEITESVGRPGVVTGLVAYSSGGNGSILFIEVADMPGDGTVQLTGKLGSVLQESVQVALTWVKAHALDLGLTQSTTENIMKDRSIHVHCPSGAIPKDGPSSGIGQAVALISLFSGRVVPPTMAMTGEISLRGKITAVGGIKEKLIGALRAGVKTVLLPAANQKDIKDLPQEVKDGLNIIHVSHVWEALETIWPGARWPCHDSSTAAPRFESRL